MKKFVVLYYSPKEAMAKMATASPEEMKAGEKDWMDWFDSLGEHLVDRGEYFSQGVRFVGSDVEDATGKVTGYSLIQADSMDQAKSLLENHPHLEWFEGCAVEAYEPMQMGS